MLEQRFELRTGARVIPLLEPDAAQHFLGGLGPGAVWASGPRNLERGRQFLDCLVQAAHHRQADSRVGMSGCVQRIAFERGAEGTDGVVVPFQFLLGKPKQQATFGEAGVSREYLLIERNCLAVTAA